MLAGQRLQAAQVAVSGRAAHLNGEADDPVGEQPARIHEEVHHVGVVGVFDATEARLDHGESGLHEHDQEAGDQGPGKVDADLVLADLVGNIAQGEADLGVGDGHVVDGAGERAAGIAVGKGGGCGRLGGGVLQLGSRRRRGSVSASHRFLRHCQQQLPGRRYRMQCEQFSSIQLHGGLIIAEGVGGLSS